MQKININLQKIEKMNTANVKETVNKWDTTNWLQVHKNSTLKLFCKLKTEIQEIKYDLTVNWNHS